MNITCSICNAKDVPNWDGKGHCITCSRDIILGELPTGEYCSSCLRSDFKRLKKDCRLHKLETIVVSIG